MASFNHQFLYSILIIALGYLLKRFNIVKEKDGEGLSRIIFNITMPALLIVSFHDIKIDPSYLSLIFIAIFYGLFIGFLGLFIFRKDDRRTKGMTTMMAPGFNIGLFAFPLVEAIWGLDGIKYFGMFDVGNAFIVFGLCYVIGSFYSDDPVPLSVKHISLKMSKSIPLMTYIIVCTISLIGLQIPKLILDVSTIVSSANMPLSLLLLGIYLNFSLDKSYAKLMWKILLLRYGLGLGLGILLFLTLPLGDMFRYTLLLVFILPISFSVLPYSVEFKYNQKFIGTTSNISILISFILLWLFGNLIM